MIRSVFVAMFAALISAGCFISVPLPGLVPISIQNMFAILSGILLGNIQGAAATGLFLTLGALGIPVFSGMTGGFAVLTGPTGGFLAGYFFGSLAAGLIAGRPVPSEKKRTVPLVVKIILATLAGYFINYALGIPWFISVMTGRGKDVDLAFALKACLIPFIPGDSIKIVLTIILGLLLRPTVGRYLSPDNDRLPAEA
ncbi:MAG: biotin transporter BioY [Treponema sp.]|nr:biotin transporter BioY [Treponema sp.]